MIRMHRVHTVVLFLVGGCCVAMTGCSNPAKERLIGKWKADIEMTEDEMASLMPKENPIAARIGKLLMKSMRAEMAWEFAADDTVIASATLLGNSMSRNGTWRCVSSDEETTTTTIEVQFENEEPREVSFTFSNPNTVEATAFSSGKWKWNRMITFKRVAPDPASK